MQALTPNVFHRVMARLDRATQHAHVHARHESYARLDGPLLRAMTIEGGE